MGLIFDGVDLELTYGVVVSGAGSWAKPERDRELVHVPGRNGDLIYDNGCWLNVEIPYSLYFRDGWLYKYAEFCEWLCSHVGYFRLEDPERHPGVYRMAEFAGPLDPKKWLLTDDGIVTITFNAKPQQFLLDGETQITAEFAQIVDGYFAPAGDNEGEWVSPGNGLGRSTVLYASGNWDYPDFSVTIKNNSKVVKTVAYGMGSYSFDTSSGEFVLRGAGAWNRTMQPGDSRTFSAGTDPEMTHTRVSVYCEDGLDGMLVSIRGSNDDVDIDLAAPMGVINNPTSYVSNPLIIMSVQSYRQPECILVVNDFEVYAHDIPSGASELCIDCELEDCYFVSDGVLVNANQYVSISNSNPKELREFPYLVPGDNTVFVKSSMVGMAYKSNFSITPRWYKI